MNENEQPVKRKRGRPPGTGKKRIADVLSADELAAEKESGGGKLAPPSRPARDLDMTAVTVPQTLLPKAEEPGAVPDMIRTVLAIRQTVDLDNPATLYNAMEQYLNLCSASGMKVSNSTLYMACGIDRRTVHYWEYGQRRQNNPAYKEFALMAKAICAAAREQYGIEGQVNPILTIFHQKFYDGFKDNPAEEAADNPLGEITDPQKLAEKYKDIILD